MTDKNGNKVNPFDILGSAMGGGGKKTNVSGGMTGSVAKSTTSP